MEPIPAVVFAIPSYPNACSLEFGLSMLHLGAKLSANGISFVAVSMGGMCFVDQARNICVANGMDGMKGKFRMTDIFFLDDDVGFPAEAVLKILARPEPIVFGAYPMKDDSGELFPIMIKQDAETGEFVERDGMVLTDTCCGGFLRIKREVIEKLSEGEKTFYHKARNGEITQCVNIFEAGVRNGAYWGEDVVFASKAQRAGFEIWCMKDIDFTHRGSKVWRNNLNTFLEAHK